MCAMKALQGVRVLDFSWLFPGPYATMLLADLGADVVKVEQPGRGDYTRTMLPDCFEVINRNKRSISLDLKGDEGRALAWRLLEDADVVVEGFRPGVMARLGLGHEAVLERFPRIIYCSLSGFGQDGPYSQIPGHDIAYMGVGGGFCIPGDLKYPPVKGPLPVADLSSGMFAALSIQAALFERQSSGLGQYLDVSMTDCIAAWAGVRLANVTWNGKPPPQRLMAANRVFETADGRRISLAVAEDQFWEAFCRTVGREDWLADARWRTIEGRREHAREMLPLIEALMLERTAEQWLSLFEGTEVPAAPVHGPMEVFEDPQIRHRKMLWQAPPDGSGAPRRMVAYPVKFSRTAPELHHVAPAQGQDTDAVLREAGLDEAAIAGLRARGVV